MHLSSAISLCFFPAALGTDTFPDKARPGHLTCVYLHQSAGSRNAVMMRLTISSAPTATLRSLQREVYCASNFKHNDYLANICPPHLHCRLPLHHPPHPRLQTPCLASFHNPASRRCSNPLHPERGPRIQEQIHNLLRSRLATGSPSSPSGRPCPRSAHMSSASQSCDLCAFPTGVDFASEHPVA